MITRENYEIYIIDYLDGNLSVENQNALFKFLDHNIDLKEEFELMKDFQMPESNIVFDNKEDLKKDLSKQSVDDTNIDEWCIAAIENDLTEIVKEKFESEISGREDFQQIYALYKQTKLEAENTSFPYFKPWRLPDFNDSPKTEDVDFWVIADLEGDLNSFQKQKWNSFKTQIINIENIENDYKRIKLYPEKILYPNKSELKHKKSRLRYLYPLGGIAAAAAAFYLFLNIANFKQDTYKNFNKQIAQFEQSIESKKYVPKTSIFPQAMLNQMAKTIEIIEKESNTEKKNLEEKYVTAKIKHSPEYASSSSIELIKKREANIEIKDPNYNPVEPPVEVIIADNLMDVYIAENNASNYNLNKNKLTLFKVAQKGVSTLNEKMGTEMKLEAQYNAQGEKKRVKFSNRLFTVTKTINK